MGASAPVEGEEVLDQRLQLRIPRCVAASLTSLQPASRCSHRELHRVELLVRTRIVEVSKGAKQRLIVEIGPGDELMKEVRVEGVELGEQVERGCVGVSNQASLEPADRAPRKSRRGCYLLRAPPNQRSCFREDGTKNCKRMGQMSRRHEHRGQSISDA